MLIGPVEVLGYLAAALVFISFCMKRMVPLRLVAVGSNLAFIGYGFFAGLTPILALHRALLPMNLWRTVEIVRLVRRVKADADGHAVADWLTPYARRAIYPAGASVFRKGDSAERMYLVVRGSVIIDEVDVMLGPKSVFGEIGMFSKARVRTQSATTMEPTELLWVEEDDLALIGHQHPGLTLYLIRLITDRLVSASERYGAMPAIVLSHPQTARGQPSRG
jgi:hypothetical protein